MSYFTIIAVGYVMIFAVASVSAALSKTSPPKKDEDEIDTQEDLGRLVDKLGELVEELVLKVLTERYGAQEARKMIERCDREFRRQKLRTWN